MKKLPKQVQVTELPAVSPRQTVHVHLCKQKHSINRICFHAARRQHYWSVCVTFQLLSLLLEALSCPDQGVQLSTLSCLQPVLVDPPPALIQQLEALFSRLLALTSSPSMVSFIWMYVKHWVSALMFIFGGIQYLVAVFTLWFFLWWPLKPNFYCILLDR